MRYRLWHVLGSFGVALVQVLRFPPAAPGRVSVTSPAGEGGRGDAVRRLSLVPGWAMPLLAIVVK